MRNVGKDCYKTQWWVSSILLNACWSSQGALWVAEHRHLTLGFCGVRALFGVGSFSETLGPLNKNLRTHQLRNYLDKLSSIRLVSLFLKYYNKICNCLITTVKIIHLFSTLHDSVPWELLHARIRGGTLFLSSEGAGNCW